MLAKSHADRCNFPAARSAKRIKALPNIGKYGFFGRLASDRAVLEQRRGGVKVQNLFVRAQLLLRKNHPLFDTAVCNKIGRVSPNIEPVSTVPIFS